MSTYRDKDDRTIWIPFPEEVLQNGNGLLGIINITRHMGANSEWIYTLNYYDTLPSKPFKEFKKTHLAGFTFGQRDANIKARINSYIEKLQDFAQAILREKKL